MSGRRRTVTRRASARAGKAVFVTAALLLPPAAHAAPKTWTNSTLNDQWLNINNWNPSGVFPTQSDDVVLPSTIPGGTSHSTISISTSGDSHSVEFDNAYTVSGDLVINTGNAIVGSGITAHLDGDVGGGQGFHKLGSGTLINGGISSNSFSGPTTIDAGVLEVGGEGKFGIFAAQNTVTINSATLRWDATSGSSRSFILGSVTSTIDVTSGSNFTIFGPVSGADLTKTGAGTLTLASANTYSGGTAINGGNISIDADNRLGATTTSVSMIGGTLATTASFTTPRGFDTQLSGGGATFDVATATTFTIAGNISGAQPVTKIGSGTLVLATTNNYVGTNINVGTVSVAADNRLGSPGFGISFNGGILSPSASFTSPRPITVNAAGGDVNVPGGITLTFTGIVSGAGTGGLTKSGSGILIFAGSNANTYSGLVTVADGTLHLNKSSGNAIANSLSIGNGTGTAPTLILDANEQIATVNVNVFGDGVFNLNGFNETIFNLTMSAGQVVGNGGTLILNSGVTTFANFSQINANLNLGGGATRVFNITNSLDPVDCSVDGVISNGGLVKNNSGTLQLTGSSSNTYSGDTTISAGGLILQKNASGIVAVPGNFFIGDGSGTDTVTLGQSEQIADTSTVTIASSGILALSNFTETIGALTMTGGQISGSGTLVLNGNVTTNASAASATIAPLVSLGAATRSFAVADGAAAVDLLVSNSITNGSLIKSGAGRMDVKNFRGQNLTLSGGTLRLIDDSTAAGVSTMSVLSIAAGAQLDLRDNKIVARNSAVGIFSGGGGGGGGYGGVSGLIQSGRNGGAWTGSGIVTSETAATTGNFTSIGVAAAQQVRSLATASDTAVWAGQTVTGSDTLVMYTYGGDANLDGKINVDDYGRIDFNVNLGTSGWFNGDFNYDGKVNVDDYGIIDFNVGIQGAPFPTGSSLIGGVAAVPEPAGAALFLLGVATAAHRRRVRQSRAG